MPRYGLGLVRGFAPRIVNLNGDACLGPRLWRVFLAATKLFFAHTTKFSFRRVFRAVEDAIISKVFVNT